MKSEVCELYQAVLDDDIEAVAHLLDNGNDPDGRRSTPFSRCGAAGASPYNKDPS